MKKHHYCLDKSYCFEVLESRGCSDLSASRNKSSCPIGPPLRQKEPIINLIQSCPKEKYASSRWRLTELPVLRGRHAHAALEIGVL